MGWETQEGSFAVCHCHSHLRKLADPGSGHEGKLGAAAVLKQE